jgi:hypothetical protein
MQPQVSSVPSTYFGTNVFGAFIEDELGAAMIGREVPVEAVMAEVDYPHSDTIYPDVQKAIGSQIDHLSPDAQYKVRRGNAERVFRFTPSGLGQR